jgi:cell division protein FtsW (lipid II flippase)
MYTGDNGIQPVYRAPVTVKHDGFTDGVIVPLLQTVITGVLFGVAVAVVLAVAGVEWWYKAGGVAVVVVMLLSWLAYRHEWRYRLEAVLGIDLNNDGQIGAPMPPPVVELPPLKVEIYDDGGRHAQFIDLPSANKLPLLAREITEGRRQFSQVAWVNSGIFTRGEYDELIAALIKAGLCQWKNAEHHNAGVLLTRAGRHVFKRLAAGIYSPAE